MIFFELERCGALTIDTIEEIYQKLCRSNVLPNVDRSENKLVENVLGKLDELLLDGKIEIEETIEMKEKIEFLEEIAAPSNRTAVIEFESRFLQASSRNFIEKVFDEIEHLVEKEQYRISKANELLDVLRTSNQNNSNNEETIVKLVEDLAKLHRLAGSFRMKFRISIEIGSK